MYFPRVFMYFGVSEGGPTPYGNYAIYFYSVLYSIYEDVIGVTTLLKSYGLLLIVIDYYGLFWAAIDY